MILIRSRTEKREDGGVKRRLFVRVENESVGPLSVLPARVPELVRGFVRTGQRVRLNRTGTWAVWSCLDVRKG